MQTYVVLENIFFSTKTSSILLMSLLMSPFFLQKNSLFGKNSYESIKVVFEIL